MNTDYWQSSTESIYPPQQPWFHCIPNFFLSLGHEVMEEVHSMEQFFIKLQNIYAFVCQMCFFILCDRAVENKGYEEIKENKSIVIALTSILFYSVFGYLMSRIRNVCQRSRYRTVQAAPSLRNYFKWLCKIFFEWLKAVVVVLCLREQGIHYEPKISYSLITFCYYVCSEKIFLEIFPAVVECFNIEYLDDMEHLYVPLVLNLLTILAGISVETYIAVMKFSNFTLISFYFIVYLRVKDLYHNNWKILKAERKAYSSFQVATQSDIQLWDDICAVCLNRMSRARITPCNHLFHPYCLKQCLKTSFYCPLCKQHFIDKDHK